MVVLIYKKIAPYLCLFLALTTFGFGVGNVWQSKVIIDLQSELIKDRNQEIKVIVEHQQVANQVSQEYEQRKADREQSKVVVTHEIEKIVSDPIYSGLCFDDNGLYALRNQIASFNDPGKPISALPSNTGDK